MNLKNKLGTKDTTLACLENYLYYANFIIYKIGLWWYRVTSGQSYKAPTIVIYVSRDVNISNLVVSTTLE